MSRQEKVTQSLVGRHELTHDRSHHGRSRSSLQALEEIGQTRGKADFEKFLPAGCPHRVQQVLNFKWHGVETLCRAAHDREEGKQGNQQHLRQGSETKPDEKHRSCCDERQMTGARKYRLEKSFKP